MTFWINFITVAAVVALADFCWSMYIIATTQLKPLKAGFWATMIIFAGAYATLSFIHDNRLVFGSALGAFVGTTLTVLWHKRRKNDNADEKPV